MLRLLRIAAVAIVSAALTLSNGYSMADDPAALASLSPSPTNVALERAINKSLEIVEAKQKRIAMKKAARKREIRKMTMPTWGKITTYFGRKGRYWSVRHTGMDIDANTGDSVRNLMKGRVVYAGWAGAYGNLVVVRTVRGGDVWYAHLSRIKVKTGKMIKSGRIIGRVGETGNAHGSHLHLEVRRNDYPVNPATFLWGKHKGKINKQKIPSWAYGPGIQHLADLY